jgi:hypothetical protein
LPISVLARILSKLGCEGESVDNLSSSIRARITKSCNQAFEQYAYRVDDARVTTSTTAAVVVGGSHISTSIPREVMSEILTILIKEVLDSIGDGIDDLQEIINNDDDHHHFSVESINRFFDSIEDEADIQLCKILNIYRRAVHDNILFPMLPGSKIQSDIISNAIKENLAKKSMNDDGFGGSTGVSVSVGVGENLLGLLDYRLQELLTVVCSSFNDFMKSILNCREEEVNNEKEFVFLSATPSSERVSGCRSR